MYYAAIDSRLTAYHSSKKVVNKYVKWYAKSHPESVCLLVKDASLTKSGKLKLSDEYELVQVGKIFIQRKYEEAYLVYGCSDASTISDAINLLQKELLKVDKITKAMEINEGIRMLEKIKQDMNRYIPSCDEMESLVQSMMEWRYCVYHDDSSIYYNTANVVVKG